MSLPTLARVPQDRLIDGVDQLDFLTGAQARASMVAHRPLSPGAKDPYLPPAATR